MPSALFVALLAEIGVFSVIAPHFLTLGNFFEVIRTSIEVGLLAIASTPILITGGIDLSIGSMMGLAAVVFGATIRETHWGTVAAVFAALLTGCAAGALNGVLIARFNLPPLIVTLGSYSMFRGIAEGIAHGAVNYSGFPPRFLFLGQGYVWGAIPAQFPFFVLVLAAYVVLLHYSALGRTLYAIGCAPGGARHAGIPVGRRIGLLYFLSGLVSSAAAIVYVAHLGQAKSDAGTNYELDAITAVVLGGTSVFGGRGTLAGTVLGLFSLSVLQNGLRLAALPTELAGVLTGALLVITISIDGFRRIASRRAVRIAGASAGAIAAGLILVGFLHSSTGGGAHRLTIAVMPKAKGDPYFVSCRKGAEEAARELGVDLIWDGPTGLDAAKQNEIVESWITRKVDAIAVAVENQAGISTVLRKARAKGIRVLTWDADAAPDARDYFINQATAQAIGYTLTDQAARLLGGTGEFAIVTGALSAANQNQWIDFIKERVAQKYPGLKLAVLEPSDDDRDKAFAQTQTIMKAFPSVKLIVAISAPAVPGAGEAVQQSGRGDVKVIGLSLPSISRPYIHSGVVPLIALWNTNDLGYLTVYAGSLLARNRIPGGASSVQAGRLGKLEIKGSEIILGAPLIIDQANVDTLDF